MKSLIDKGVILNILSCSVFAVGGTKDRSSISAGLKYFTERKVEVNMVIIGFGHSDLFLRYHSLRANSTLRYGVFIY